MSTACADILSDSDEDVGPSTDLPTANDTDEVISDEEIDLEDEESEEDEEEPEEGEELNGVDAKPFQITSDLPTISRNFSQLNLHSWLVNQLTKMKIAKPTPVQDHCIPKVLEGCDVLGCAKTGTGKTLAFALPILNTLAVDPFGVYALIITPTRELAYQISEQFAALGKPISLKCATVVGGTGTTEQACELIKRPHVVVGTPGRLADHISRDPEGLGKIFDKIQYFVLDEADRLLDGQYNEQLKTIFEAIPKKRQTLLFSATITSAISQLHKVSVRKPFFFEDVSEVTTADKLEQKYVLCPVAVKDSYLVYVVKNFCERNEKSSVIVFAQTCRECQALALMFNALGFQVGSMHSQIPQRARLAALSAFRSKTVRIIICTDVASRGLDIPHVDLVVNHNVPKCPKTYIHRVGRSARAGRFGSAVTFVTQYDVVLLQAVEALIGKKLEELKVNENRIAKYVTKVIIAKREAEVQLDQQNFGEKAEKNKRLQLLLSGMSEEQVDQHMDNMKSRRGNGMKRQLTTRRDDSNKRIRKKT